MNVGVVAAVKLRGRVNHRLRLVGCRRVVQPDERLAVHQLMQRGEIPAHALNVKFRQGHRGLGIRLAGERRLAGNIPAAQEIIVRRGGGLSASQPGQRMVVRRLRFRFSALGTIVTIAARFAEGITILGIRRVRARRRGFFPGQFWRVGLGARMHRRHTGCRMAPGNIRQL